MRNHASARVGVRFLYRDHGDVSRVLRLRGLGHRHAPDTALECDRPSDGGWTAQQVRMVVSGDRPHRWLIHDRGRIYSEGVDATLAAMGLTMLNTPARAPQANAFCERLIGSHRRECLDWLVVAQ